MAGSGWHQAAKVLVGAVVAGAAALAGFVLGHEDTPEILRPGAAVVTFPVTLSSFVDPRSVRIVPTPVPAAAITSGLSGILTRSSCQPGGVVASGTTPWAVDGRPVLALATSEPMYRDLGPGAKGTDVRALQRELKRLGYAVGVDGSYGPETAQVVSTLRARGGLAAGRSLALAEVAWVPRAQTVVTSCAALGRHLIAGDPLAQTQPELAAAQVKPMPTDLVSGTRVLDVGGLELSVDEAGRVAASDLDKLAALPQTAIAVESLGQGSEVPLSGDLRLRTPLAAATLPSASVVVSGDNTCVVTGSTITPVEILSSTLGQTIVSFSDATVPRQIDVYPIPTQTCD